MHLYCSVTLLHVVKGIMAPEFLLETKVITLDLQNCCFDGCLFTMPLCFLLFLIT